ncbi:MAG: hypothetical protein U1E65_11665 [Myxococcota bacterium]
MRRFLGALGLRGYERVIGGTGTRADLRWSIPLPRGPATWVKDKIEQAPSFHRDLVVPKHPTRAERFEASIADTPSARAAYLPGGSFASLRRVLVIDAVGASIEEARRKAARCLAELSIPDLAQEPDPEVSFHHLRAAFLLQRAPRLWPHLWTDAVDWPPDVEELVRLERELGVTRADLTPIRGLSDRASAFVFVRDRPFGADVLGPTLYAPHDSADDVAALISFGFLAPRWLLLGHGIRPTTLAGAEDLKGLGAGFVSLKCLFPKQIGTFIHEQTDYLVMVNHTALDRVERWFVDRDNYGTLAPLEQALPEPQLQTLVRSQLLGAEYEVLFPDALPSTLILGVLCRSEAARVRLEQLLVSMRTRIRLEVSDRYLAF